MADKNNNTPDKPKLRERVEKPLSRFTLSMQRAVNADGPMSNVLSIFTLYTALGQFLYRIGFQCEYFLLCAKRFSKLAIIKFCEYFKLFASITGVLLKRFFGFVFHDLIEVFRKVYDAFVNVRAIVKNESALSKGQTLAASLKYIAKGVHKHRSIWLSLASYALPIGAGFIFVYTASTMLDYSFGLRVEYKDNVIGYINNELVFDEAQELVRGRIKTTGNEDLFTVVPTVHISVAGKETFTSRETLADNIIQTSEDQIQPATGILISGELLGVTTDGEVLYSTLESMKSTYYNPEIPDMRVEFVKDVELIDGLYYTASLTDANSILGTLTGEVTGKKTYLVQKGDSPSGIAQKNGIPLKDLYALNPHMEEKGYKMPIGDELTVSRTENFLQVKTIEPVVYEQEVAFAVEQEKNDTMFEKQTKVIQKGANGADRVTAEVVKIDGVQIETVELSRERILEPVVQKVQVGTKSLATAGASSVGTGSMLFPVPNLTYITTRFGQGGHLGVDLCAPYGTPVRASDSGTVVAAGWHYSYGNYVQINHGNGITTLYAHNSALYVSAGQTVARGQAIGAIGSTGNSSGNHCHFEMTVGGGRVNPLNYVG